MHIQDCLSPIRVYDKFDKTYQLVPCGRCAACLNHHASEWVARLNQERYCWKYCLFFTLTYNDENIPSLERQSDSYCYADSRLRVNRSLVFPFVNGYDYLDKDTDGKLRSWLDTHRVIHRLNPYDVQCFIKRVRIHVERHLFNNPEKNLLNEKVCSLRYFVCGEYGPKNLRPHYHGLFFFNSDLVASNLPQIIREDWQFGFVSSSYVEDTNSTYVATYLNCTSHLPKIYRDRWLRPFSLSSRRPPIGTLASRDEAIRELFMQTSTDLLLLNHDKKTFENVPLWKTFKSRLYPRLTAFDHLSDIDRIKLYRVSERYPQCENAEQFINVVRNHPALQLDKIYSDLLYSTEKDGNGHRRWFQISTRICKQAEVWDLSSTDYAKKILEFYQKLDKVKLHKQFEFEETFSKEFPSAQLLGLDVDYLKELCAYEIYELSQEQITTLRGFGVDMDLFLSDDADIAQRYRESLFPHATRDFQVFKSDMETIRNKNTKTKSKYEYIRHSNGVMSF